MQKKLWYILPVIVFLFAACTRTVYTNDPAYAQPRVYGPGIGLGTIIAVVISWTRNKSILWAIIHGILGWLYVIYAIFFKKKD